MLLFVIIVFALFIIYIVIYRLAEIQKFHRHQKEWDNIKSNLSDEDEISKEYDEYIDMLYKRESASWLGACFPKE